MKKRLLSLFLCFVMVFSLLPVGALALYRPVEEYVSAGTNWQNTTDYQSAANRGNDKTLYYKDGDNYYPVSWNSGQQLYTISGSANKAWTPRDIGNSTSYYYNVGGDKLTFSQVSTKSGDLFYASQAGFPSITSDGNALTSIHTN